MVDLCLGMQLGLSNMYLFHFSFRGRCLFFEVVKKKKNSIQSQCSDNCVVVKYAFHYI